MLDVLTGGPTKALGGVLGLVSGHLWQVLPNLRIEEGADTKLGGSSPRICLFMRQYIYVVRTLFPYLFLSDHCSLRQHLQTASQVGPTDRKQGLDP